MYWSSHDDISLLGLMLYTQIHIFTDNTYGNNYTNVTLCRREWQNGSKKFLVSRYARYSQTMSNSGLLLVYALARKINAGFSCSVLYRWCMCVIYRLCHLLGIFVQMLCAKQTEPRHAADSRQSVLDRGRASEVWTCLKKQNDMYNMWISIKFTRAIKFSLATKDRVETLNGDQARYFAGIIRIKYAVNNR